MTTKRFPRTMQEAFGVDARSAYPIEHYKRHLPDLIDALLLAAAIAVPTVLTVLFFPNGV